MSGKADDRRGSAGNAAHRGSPAASGEAIATSEALPASTVVLARDRAGGGIAVYLVQRHASMGFMGGMHVFPGGKVCAADASRSVRARVTDLTVAAPRHAVWGEGVLDDAAIARAVAAVRETFEEAGVLVCAGREHPLDPAALRHLRARLLGGDDLGSLLEAAGIRLELSALVPLSRWITPESERIRFDTSFYVARVPDGQQPEHDGHENTAGSFMTPDEALENARRGHIRLAPPTQLTLQSLAAHDSVDAALEVAARRAPPAVLPIIRTVGSEVLIFYPGDPEHPVPTAAFSGPTRRVLRRV